LTGGCRIGKSVLKVNMKILKKIAAVLILSSLISCGGGGGGSSSGGGGNSGQAPFQVTLDRTSVNLTITEGQSGASTIVTATGSGSNPGQLYIGAIVEGTGIDPNISYTSSGANLYLGLRVANGLVAGTYTGRVVFYACSDYYCDHPVGGTPLAINYTVIVQPTLTITPNPISLNAVSGNLATGALAVTLPSGATSFSVVAPDAPTWLQIGSPSSSTVQLTAQSMRSGTYTTSVLVTANTGQAKLVPVTYTVTPPAGGEHDLAVTPYALGFSAVQGASTAAQTLSFSNPTWAPSTGITLTTSYITGSGWLTVTPIAGGASLVANAAGMSPGTYTAILLVTPQSGNPVSIPVTFTVGAGLVTPANNTVTVNTQTVVSGLSGVVPIAAGGGVSAFPWTAASNQSWLTLTRAAGLTGTNLTYDVDQSALQAFTNYSDVTATITVTPVGTSYAPVQFTVTVRKLLPEVHYVGPYVLVSGRATTVHVRGRGFLALSNVSAQVPGLAPSTQTILSDTELTVLMTPANVGDYTVSIANALGMNAGSAALHVIAPQTYTYTAIPTSGLKRSISLDPQRESAYVVNPVNQTIERFRFSGSAWNKDQQSIGNILDAGMGPDGSELIVTSTPGAVRLLDPSTLATQFSLAVPEGLVGGYGVYWSQGISTSNNGRSWLGVGQNSAWGELKYFDHRTRSMMTRPTQNESFNFYNPWTAMSRNGERMLVSADVGLSPASALLYSDAIDSVLHRNLADSVYYNTVVRPSSVFMAMSDDGSRVLFDSSEVRDASFNLVGYANLPVPAPTPGASYKRAYASVISPDGTRVYILAYDSGVLSQYPQPTSIKPTVYVFDSSTATIDLPLIGSFDLQDYPTCRLEGAACLFARAAISPDGNTLFFVGDENFVVAPISPLYRVQSVTNATSKSQLAPIRANGSLAPMGIWNLNK
jgi:hypothetical protein